MYTGQKKKKKYLELWDRIEIVTGESSESGHYLARIEDFRDAHLVISAPELLSGHTLLRDNADCIVFFNREDAMYRFHSRISVLTSDGRRFYILQAPDEIRRVQRREFVRVDFDKQMSYALLTRAASSESTNLGKLKWRDGRCHNVSGGGVLLQVEHEVRKDDIVILKCPLFDEIGLPEAIAGICRRVDIKDKKRFCGIEFILEEAFARFVEPEIQKNLPKAVLHFDQMMQNRLVLYIFQQQVALRKKGLL